MEVGLDWESREAGMFLVILSLNVLHGPASEGATAVCDCGMEEGLGGKEGDGGRMGVTGAGETGCYVCGWCDSLQPRVSIC